ncbi:O-methyltransferase MdmC isoform X2 [Capsicum annuum]|uniref:O-methyltransferase MdmC isoform X2 n=1 Tax=Capsicum annuum TaxID=4072 RepID=UPI0007BFE12A|nr:O-methyltransferase MdmC isoform X2 [Capsicum annuum]
MSRLMMLGCTNSFALFRPKFNGHLFPSIYHINVSSLMRHVSSTTALSFCQLQASKLHDSPVTVASDVRYGGKRIISVDSPLYDYILSNVREPKILRELREETATMRGSQMQVSPDQAQLLAMLVQILGAKRCIEVGTYTGYSSLGVALVLPEGGCLVACERDGKSIEVAQRYYDRAGVSHKVDVRHGLAADTLKSLIQNGEICRYDFAFVDAEKRMYQEYFELLLQLVNDSKTLSIRDFNENLMKDNRVDISMVPVGDGMTICRKR